MVGFKFFLLGRKLCQFSKKKGCFTEGAILKLKIKNQNG
jgi:hypothetical protein